MTHFPIDNRPRMAQISPMRTLALVILAAVALSGCASCMEKRGYVKNQYGNWVKPGERYFGDNPPGVRSESPLLREARLRNEANYAGVTPPMPNLIPAQDTRPMPAQVIVDGSSPYTTIQPTPSGGTSVVNYGVPAFTRPAPAPYYYGY